jgi:predicted transposase YbfD/YdcC
VATLDYIAYLRRHQAWPQLTSLVKIVSERRVNGQPTVTTRYFIASFSSSAQHFLQLCRDHWHIETQLHWVLDVAFRQDHNRGHKDHAPKNLAVMQHIALNLLKQETTARTGVNAKRLKAGWDNTYLLQVLAG